LDGIIYSASGEEHVGMALASARSSLRHNSVPHVLFASPAPTGDAKISGLEIEPFEPSDNPYVDKIENIRRSRFERTLFLDSDTFVVDEIVHVLQLLDHYEVAAAFAPGNRAHADPDVPFAFYEFNTGVIAWRASERTDAFFADWQETYVAWQAEKPFENAAWIGGPADQPAFRRCAWKHRIQIMPLGPEYNYRTRFPGSVVDRVRVIHGRQDDYEGVAEWLNKKSGPRAFPVLTPESIARFGKQVRG
jgi:hypothetical protein